MAHFWCTINSSWHKCPCRLWRAIIAASLPAWGAPCCSRPKGTQASISCSCAQRAGDPRPLYLLAWLPSQNPLALCVCCTQSEAQRARVLSQRVREEVKDVCTGRFGPNAHLPAAAHLLCVRACGAAVFMSQNSGITLYYYSRPTLSRSRGRTITEALGRFSLGAAAHFLGVGACRVGESNSVQPSAACQASMGARRRSCPPDRWSFRSRTCPLQQPWWPQTHGRLRERVNLF